jgi:hypothetical protein
MLCTYVHILLRAFIWFLKTYAIPAGMYASQTWSAPYLLQQGKKDGQSPSEMAVGSVEKDIYLGSETPCLHGCHGGHARVWIETPTVQLNIARQCGCTILWLTPTATQ